jgi:transposase
MKKRGELIERSFAHCYETGAMRRVHLRGRENVWKRQLIHVGAFNLGLVLRRMLGVGTPRELRNRQAQAVFVVLMFSIALATASAAPQSIFGGFSRRVGETRRSHRGNCRRPISGGSTTDC